MDRILVSATLQSVKFFSVSLLRSSKILGAEQSILALWNDEPISTFQVIDAAKKNW